MARERAVASLAVSVVARTKRFVKGLQRAKKSLRKFTGEIGRVGKRIAKFGIALASVAAGGGFVLLIRNSFRTIDALGKVSDRLGIATDKLAGLQLAGKLAGVETRQLELAMQRMTRRVAEAAADTGEAKDAIKQLGLNAKTLFALSPDQQMLKFAEALSKVDIQALRVRLAFKLFDSEGVKVLNMLQDGGKAMKEAIALAQHFGTALTNVQVGKVTDMNDQFAMLRERIKGVADQIAVGLAPAFTQLLADMNNVGFSGENLAQALGDMADFAVRRVSKLLDVFHNLRGLVLLVRAEVAKGLFPQLRSNLERMFLTLRMGTSASPMFQTLLDKTLGKFIEKHGPLFGSIASDAQQAYQDFLKETSPSERFGEKMDAFTKRFEARMREMVKAVKPSAALSPFGDPSTAKTATFKQINLSRFAINALAGLRGKVQTVRDPESVRKLEQIRTLLARPSLAVVG